MRSSHARLIFVLSLLLLAVVTLDFVKIGSETLKESSQNQVNLVDAVGKVGDALSGSNSVLGDKTATDSAKPMVNVREPVSNFETNNKNLTIVGSVPDLQAKASIKLNDIFLENLKLASVSGDFRKSVELKPGANKITVTAVATTGATTTVDIAGTFFAKAESGKMLIYVLLFLLSLPAIYGIIRSIRHLRSKNSK